MTHKYDVIRLKMEIVPDITISCKEAGIEWPPPEVLELKGHKFKRTRMSEITDEQIQEMGYVSRGAEYEMIMDYDA